MRQSIPKAPKWCNFAFKITEMVRF